MEPIRITACGRKGCPEAAQRLTKEKPLTYRCRSGAWDRLIGATPTLSRSFVAAPFQLGLVWLSVLSTLPPNPSACPRVGVWDKPWDKFANYFETASPHSDCRRPTRRDKSAVSSSQHPPSRHQRPAKSVSFPALFRVLLLRFGRLSLRSILRMFFGRARIVARHGGLYSLSA